MINLIQKAQKWPKMLKEDTAYLQHFHQAILNFEQNIIEERDMISNNKGRKRGFRSEIRF